MPDHISGHHGPAKLIHENVITGAQQAFVDLNYFCFLVHLNCVGFMKIPQKFETNCGFLEPGIVRPSPDPWFVSSHVAQIM
jgi:hypothetical protein